MFEKKIETQQAIDALLAKRWSGRAYDAQRAVTREQIISLLEAARWAPSCFGAEPWRYIVCDKQSSVADWDRAFACLAEGNQSWAKHAPMLLLVLAASTFEHNGKENRWAMYDTGAATMNLCIQATALDLMVHQMGGFDVKQATKSFAVPSQYVAMAMMAVGYQLAEDEITGEMQQREFAVRQRKPFAEHCFEGQWGNPLT